MGKKVLVDLSHPFGADMPMWPYFKKPNIDTMHSLAKSGVLSQSISGITMHTGTHADAPRHVMEREFNGKRARHTHELPLDAYYGDAVCLDIQVEDWGLIKPAHLADACKRANIEPEELKGMVLCLRTGMHLKYDDSKDYYHYSCGCGRQAGEWFATYQPKCVAMDQQALDHPLHTAMGKNGPTQMNLPGNSGRPRNSRLPAPVTVSDSLTDSPTRTRRRSTSAASSKRPTAPEKLSGRPASGKGRTSTLWPSP